MYQTQSNTIRGLSKEDYSILREMCSYSNNLYNVALYNIRQNYLSEKTYLYYEKNYHLCKDNENFKLLQSNIAHQTLKLVDRAYKAYFECVNKVKKGDYDSKCVRPPKYRKKNDLYEIVIPSANLIINDGMIRIPMSRPFMKLHLNKKVFIPFPKNLDLKSIREIKIVPLYNGKIFKILFIYTTEKENLNLNPKNVIGVDIGLDNLATCVCSNGTAFIMDGRKIKSINHYWNKQIAKLSSIADKQGYKHTQKIANLSHKRNNRCNDIIKKTARYLINHCIENNIGTVVIGYNKQFTHCINLGAKTNQQFTQISFFALRRQLHNLCERYGMTYIEQEESYTSKASFLDGDFIPVYDKDKSVDPSVFSGKRIKRGLYRSKDMHIINADANAACNILRKNDRSLQEIPIEILASPERIRVIR